MTSYLIKSGALPFSGADVCAELGIDPVEFAATIEGMIAVECCNSSRPVLASVWWVSDGPRFAQESVHGGQKPSGMGAPVEYNGERFVPCTYIPAPEAADAIHGRILRMARTSDDINLWRAIREADPVNREALSAPVVASAVRLGQVA